MTITATIRNSEDMEKRWFCGGGTHLWLAREAETADGFMLFEDLLVGGKVTPLHTHPHEESFYMVEGSIHLHVAGADHELRAGGFAIVPRDTAHAFRVTTDTARVLSLHTPAGGEDFFRRASEPAQDGATPPPVDFDRVVRAGIETHAMTVLGPPPF
jgi:quercetin dioxygenase-like cupin family protein